MKYWLRVRKLDNSVLVNKAFLDDTKLCVNGKPSFISQMVMLFQFIGLDSNMLQHPGISIDKNVEKQFSQICEKKLKDKFPK